MKKSYCKSRFLILFILFSFGLSAQEGIVTVRQNAVIDSLLKIKIDNDREIYSTQYYTIQLYYGIYSGAVETLAKVETTFPELEVFLSFETPNYKVQLGRYKDKSECSKALDGIKEEFPAAFLLLKK